MPESFLDESLPSHSLSREMGAIQVNKPLNIFIFMDMPISSAQINSALDFRYKFTKQYSEELAMISLNSSTDVECIYTSDVEAPDLEQQL
jgi:hypothetical protein